MPKLCQNCHGVANTCMLTEVMIKNVQKDKHLTEILKVCCRRL